MQQTYLAIDSLSKSYGNFIAVNGVSLDVGRGEFFSLLGPSGCGKSTLLRMIAGFETPTSGRVVLDRSDVTMLPAERRPTNMMFQSYALFPHLSVAKNIAFGLLQERLPKAEIESRLADVGHKLHLKALLDRKPSQLSGGQRQRVALARALVKRPKVLLLDEPLGALDKNLRTETQDELVRLQKDLGLTFIIVTHDQHEAMTVSSRIAIMQSGRVLQVGSPETVYEGPVSRYVAKFLGEANIFEVATTEAERGQARLTLSGFEGQFGARLPAGISPDGPLWLSVRPERVDLVRSGPGLPGVIEDVTYSGVQRRYRVRLATNATLDALKVNSGSHDDLAVGVSVVARWADDAAHLLSE
ncbi:polyamine ABC transporter ATP-binding protein [Rhizobium sp. H4]|uniref:ABC transporter ATP-binding protein n=1 Tax=Rhizobium TaxID=379 RepID=UPI000BE94A0E|nr:MULTISPECIES: ABC transporter ATP-binding protein [Rhizobium]PDV85628.1 polyamine ABC transporter ATP-binding protein [Rhizobium sp. H4]WET73187.1 ABC transporter ATP-binding protein [Rhizobium croatiense]